MSSTDNLNDWLAYLDTVDPNEIDLRLQNVQQLGQSLNLTPLPYRLITVAGTNGKGSCVAMLRQILSAQGYRVGTYTSPHLMRYNERITIDGAEISDQDLIDAFVKIDQARDNTSLTYFEFGTLAAHLCFQKNNIDIAVMEIGLGGRLDAVNAFDPDASLVTSIGLDHQQWLGDNRSDIALEKAAIFRTARPAICADLKPPSSLGLYAKRIGSEFYQLDKEFGFKVGKNDWQWRGPQSQTKGLPLLRGQAKIQYQNAAGVIMALKALTHRIPVSDIAIKRGLASFFLAGRLQVVSQRPSVILDVAHNSDAVLEMRQYLIDRPISGQTFAVFSLLDDKDSLKIISIMQPIIDSWYIAELASDRSAKPATLAAQVTASHSLKKPVVSTYDSPIVAFKHARRAARQRDRIVVFGSFYLVGDILAYLQD